MIVSAELNVECFIVSTAAVRLELETHNRRYWDTMSTMLYSSILFDVANLNKFIEESVTTLQSQSSSTKQVNSNHKKIVDATHEVNHRWFFFNFERTYFFDSFYYIFIR